jgi:hypothetical protein
MSAHVGKGAVAFYFHGTRKSLKTRAIQDRRKTTTWISCATHTAISAVSRTPQGAGRQGGPKNLGLRLSATFDCLNVLGDLVSERFIKPLAQIGAVASKVG